MNSETVDEFREHTVRHQRRSPLEAVRARVPIPHFYSALITCGFMAVTLITGRILALHVEQTHFATVAPEVFPNKIQGLVFQRVAADAANVLPAYGSSELTTGPPAAKAANFFSMAPSGFQVSPIARQRASSLTILEKIAALGTDLRGRKVVISISPSWFLSPSVTPARYAGNFSAYAANALAFGSAFDFGFKHEIASRMLEFPGTLAKRPLLKFAVQRLASGQWFDRLAYDVIWPLGQIQEMILDLQDHFGAMIHLLRERKRVPQVRSPRRLDWQKLIAKASDGSAFAVVKNENPANGQKRATAPADMSFVRQLNSTREWADFDLLLRALAKMHVRALLISTPICAQCYGPTPLPRPAREVYYHRMHELARRYGFPLVEFEEHDTDRAFLDRGGYHMSAKGWMFYDHALDDFFHDTLPLPSQANARHAANWKPKTSSKRPPYPPPNPPKKPNTAPTFCLG